MRNLKRRLQAVVNIVSRDEGVEPDDVDLVRDAYQQVVALNPADEQTPRRVSALVKGVADVLDGAEEMQYGNEARQQLVATAPELHWSAEDIGLNVDRLRELADFIESLPTGQFDMDHWGNNTAIEAVQHIYEHGTVACDTPACIGGWAAVLYGGDAVEDTAGTSGAAYGLQDIAAAALGLTGTSSRTPAIEDTVRKLGAAYDGLPDVGAAAPGLTFASSRTPAGPCTLGDDLFAPGDVTLATVTQHDAARVLRHLADTGRVDWSIIDGYDEKAEAGGS